MRKIKFPQEYVKHGRFTLHSGGLTDTLYDVNSLLTDDFYVRHILAELPEYSHYVGISTGGAIIAGMVWLDRPMSKFSMVKDGELKGERPSEPYLLIDDVSTTEKSLREAISIVGIKPAEIVVMVDRRQKDKKLKINSIFDIS